MARPTKYKAEYPAQAAKLCKLGATDKDLAEFFGVSESTLNLWKLRYPKFSEAIKRSKDEMDALVERSLFQRAIGYTYDSERIFMPAGRKTAVRVPVQKHVPPDVTACAIWLNNRKPDDWRQRRDRDDPPTDETAEPVTVNVNVVSARKRKHAGSDGK